MTETPGTDADVQGYLLLTISHIEAWLPGSSSPTTGPLSVVCVTLPVPASLTGSAHDERDVWLVLLIDGKTEIPVSASQVVFHDRSQHLFRFVSDGQDDWEIKIPEPTSQVQREDLETFEVVLSQYAAVESVQGMEARSGESSASAAGGKELSALASGSMGLTDARSPSSSSAASPPLEPYGGADLRNQLVLVDEKSGVILGQLAENVHIREDPSILAPGNEKAPVVVDLPSAEQRGRGAGPEEVLVHTVPYDQQDFLMRSAHLLSRGIVYTTSLLSSGITAASSYYVSKTKPNEEPLVFSESTRTAIRQVHNLTGVAVQVTAKTTGLINQAVETAVSKLSGSSKGKKASTTAAPSPARSFNYQPHLDANGPPLPPRTPSPQPPPPYSSVASPSSSSSRLATPATPPRRLPLLNRVLLSTDLLLTTLETSGKQILEHGSAKLSEAVGHKYGKDAGAATLQLGQSATNVGVVYIDARGVGRRALLRRAGKTFVKAKLGKRDVEIGAPVDTLATGGIAVGDGKGNVGGVGTSMGK